MMPPKTIKHVRSLLGLINYYRDMWSKRSHLLQSLTTLTLTKVTFKWTDVEQKAFNKGKQLVAHNTLLIYPDFNQCFNIHMSASDF